MKTVLVCVCEVLWWLVFGCLAWCVDVDLVVVVGVVCYLWYCMFLKCIVCNGIDCCCTAVFLKWAFFLICDLSGTGGVGRRGDCLVCADGIGSRGDFLICWGYVGPGVLSCIGWIVALECYSKVFAALVVLRLLLQSVSFVILCSGGPGRLQLVFKISVWFESLLLI